MKAITLKNLLLAVLGFTLILAGASALGETDPVPGWFKAGNNPGGYTIGTDEDGGEKLAFIQSVKPVKGKFGTLMQSFEAHDYRGRRIRLHAEIRTQDVDGWVGAWMRVDRGKKSVSFDNMQDRALKGTTDWAGYDIVLDVPEEADNIALGLILEGGGRAEWRGIKFETVDKSVPLTDMWQQKTSSSPRNLDFEN